MTPPICPRCTMRPRMEQVDDAYGEPYLPMCGQCTHVADTIEIVRLKRVRDVAIAHILKQDVVGAMAALCAQRASPEFFDLMRFEE